MDEERIFKANHDLKILPEYFEAVLTGRKTFEVRRNDRNFKLYDIVKLSEYDGHDYTGDYMHVEIIYILDDPNYCKDGYIVFGFRLCPDVGASVKLDFKNCVRRNKSKIRY